MERIKQALEKARQQKAGEAVDTARQTPTTVQPAWQPAAANQAADSAATAAAAAQPSASKPGAPEPSAPEPGAPKPGAPKPGAPKPGAPKDDAIDVNYVNTDVVKLDPAHLARHRIISFNKNLPNNWVFDILRTKVMQKMGANGWRTVGITSPLQGAGKTVVAINLAMSIAHQMNRTAMLVDFDLVHPRVGPYLGLRKKISLNEVLAGKEDLSQAMINPDLPRLVVVPTNRPEQKASEILMTKKVGNLITDLRDRYQDRIVMFDLPPLLSSDHAMAVLPSLDCVLIVVGNGMSDQRELDDCMRLLPPDKLLGVVLNKAEGPANRYYGPNDQG